MIHRLTKLDLDIDIKTYLPSNWSYVSLLPADSINGTVEDLSRYAIALTPDEDERCPLFTYSDTLDTMLTTSYPGTAHGFFEYVGEYRSVGHGMDLSTLPQGRTMPFLASSVIVLLTSALFFFIAPLLVIIVTFQNRKKQVEFKTKRFNFCHSILVLCGTVTILNNLICSARMLINNYRTFAEMKQHILLNYPLLLGTIITILYSVNFMRKTVVSKKRKVMCVITIILLIALFTLLIGWNYFAVVG